ncbi:uncharacterized protein LOC116245508 isoform X2 [Nymphaea colorata]|uniref:uncharacterized protein LOC116245508 isoform X2 n=1 Tax=Nymphaea colorata TaxID=210225 RepID=UPI00129E4054|nr:uncharacterized protein LOC116245508 isoform X2 [Nymphaea colorata]
MMSPAQAIVEVKEENNHEFFNTSDVKATRIHEKMSTVLGTNQELSDLDKDVVDSEKALDCDCNLNGVGDEVIDILENADTGMRLSPTEGTTECSSSFSNTGSSGESSIMNSGDAEVESQYHCDSDVSRLFMRKKTLTADWKKYRRPLMWRCHWLELRMKELQSQTSKYDRLLLEIGHGKQLKYTHDTLGSSAARVVPFSSQCFETRIKKRRKRKRVEDMVDVQSHMSAHPLFSYYEKKKKVDTDGIEDDCSSVPVVIEEPNNSTEDFGINSDWTSIEWKDSESFLEKVLWKIEGLQSHVLKLKNQLNKLILKSAAKALVENSSHCVAVEPVTSSMNLPLSPAHDEAKLVEGLYAPCQQLSEYEAGNLFIPGSAVSSFADHAMLDIDDTGKCLFSLADMPLDQAPMGDSCEDIFEEVLIDNQAAEEGLQNYEVCQPVEKTCHSQAENGRNGLAPAVSVQPYERKVEEESDGTLAPTPESSVLKLCLLSDVHVPKNKRNRVGRRVPSSVRNSENSVSGTDQDN